MKKFYTRARAMIINSRGDVERRFYYEDVKESTDGRKAVDELIQEIFDEYGENVDVDDDSFMEVA